MRIRIISIGSYGDLFPMVSLARAFAERGHHVILMAASSCPDAIDTAAFRFIALSDTDVTARSRDNKWWLATRYAPLYVERYAVGWNYRAYATLARDIEEDTVVIAVDRPNLWADLLARARFGIPTLRMLVDLPVLPSRLPSELPAGRVHRLLAARCEAKWRQMLTAGRFDSGRLTLERLWRSVRPTISTVALWPEWVLGDCGSYGIPTFGFLPGPVATEVVVDAAMTCAAKPFVVFVAGTEGTTGEWAQRFFNISAAVCSDMQCAGVFLTGSAAVQCDSPFIEVRRFAPLEAVLRGAAAIVHHGGIGTAAAAIARGIPQLIVPRVFLQPSNAEWLRQLGVCTVLEAASYTVARVTAALREVLEDRSLRVTAEEYSRRCNPKATLDAVCAYVENPDVLAQLRATAPGTFIRHTRSRDLAKR